MQMKDKTMNPDIRDGSGEIINGWIAQFSNGLALIFHADNLLYDAVHHAHVYRQRREGRAYSDELVTVFFHRSLFNEHRRRSRKRTITPPLL